MSQFDQLAAGALVRARPWDVVGAALAAPMILWGFLGWFGTVGDSSGGDPGFYAGAGATGIGLVLAASALALNQILTGRAHDRSSPPVAVFLAGAAAIIVLGGMIAKPDSATIQAGSVAGLLTAISQGVVLTFGWLRGSEKSVKAANVRAVAAEQAAADLAAAQQYAPPPYGAPVYPPAPAGQGYGGSPPFPGQSGAPGQSYPAPRYGGQPYAGQQPYPGQPYAGQQPYPGQPYPGQPYAGQQPYPGQPYAGQQPYPGGNPQQPPSQSPSGEQYPYPPR